MNMSTRITRITAAAATGLVAALALTGVSAATASAAPAKAAKTVTCTPANTKISVSTVSRPINHLLIKATNKGKTPCYSYGAPLIGFDHPQSTVWTLDESRPQAVVTLKPGQSAYASVLTSGGDGAGSGGHLSKEMSLNFEGRAMAGSVGPTAFPKVPAKTWVDDSAAVSYWQSTAADALIW
ncbi:DUF4232 domain-containing protein [Streptomyces sp. NPDC090052]|uniref:DUF4232 domain-containing protein n=2 Tax=Streptomyces TaxID=1883 RepID=UPI002E1F0E1C|nr:DUF4232 domain-containing protein [Streptomyces sp. NBC_00963]WSX68076.1 DUF4232 domain-containing protein [Streptomyces sp. NBC_00932]